MNDLPTPRKASVMPLRGASWSHSAMEYWTSVGSGRFRCFHTIHSQFLKSLRGWSCTVTRCMPGGWPSGRTYQSPREGAGQAPRAGLGPPHEDQALPAQNLRLQAPHPVEGPTASTEANRRASWRNCSTAMSAAAWTAATRSSTAFSSRAASDCSKLLMRPSWVGRRTVTASLRRVCR